MDLAMGSSGLVFISLICLGLDMAAERMSHRRKQLVGGAGLLARAETGLECRREDNRRHCFLDSREPSAPHLSFSQRGIWKIV
jgi:hypothetical protein